jgi:hypothetical protein
LADHGFVRPLAREQAERPEQNTFARAGLACDRSEPSLKLERHFFQKGEIPNPKRLQHPGNGPKKSAAIKRENTIIGQYLPGPALIRSP